MLLKCNSHFNILYSCIIWATIETSEWMHCIMWATMETTEQMQLRHQDRKFKGIGSVIAAIFSTLANQSSDHAPN